MRKFSKLVGVFLSISVLFMHSEVIVQADVAKTVVGVEEVFHTHIGTGGTTSANGCFTVGVTGDAVCNYNIHNGSAQRTQHCTTCNAQTAQTLVMVATGGHTCGERNGDIWGEHVCNTCGTKNYSYGMKQPVGSYSHTYKTTVYEAGCGYSEDVPVGTVSLVKTVGTSYVLSVEITDTLVPVSYLWSNGSTSDSLEVTANGSYSVDVKYLEGTTEGSVHFDYVVSDYDTTPPVVDDVVYEKARGNKVDFEVRASDNMQVIDYMLSK